MNIKKERQSNFELLRIVSMMMIVGLHYFNGSMGGALSSLETSHFNFYLAYLLESLFILGVNCFILITGYFQIGKTNIRLNKVVELLVLVFFYGLIFYGLSLVVGEESFSLIGLIKATVPFVTGKRWFIEAFIILYMLIPFLNAGLNQLEKKSYQTLLVITLLVFSFWPSFLPSPPVTDNGYGIINFILIYAIGGYLKKHHVPKQSQMTYLLGYLICGFVIFSGSVASAVILGGSGLGRIWGYNFIFNIMGSVFLFLFFSKIKFQSHRINHIATFALGVYFIHSDPSFAKILYQDIFRTTDFWYSPYFLVHAVISIILIYILATVGDMIRKWAFDKIGKIILPFFKKRLPIIWKSVS